MSRSSLRALVRRVDPTFGEAPAMAVAPAGRRSLPLVIAPMLFLATLATALVLAVGGLVERWHSGLQGTATVEVPPAIESAGGDAAAADRRTAAERARLAAVMAVLAAAPEVEDARVLSADELVGLVDPWIDGTLLLDDLPVPAIIDVELAAGPADLAALAEAVAEAAPGARLDTHQQWLGAMVGMAGAIRLVGLVVVLVAVGAAVATIVVITRAELMIHQRTIAILHVMGATDAYIAGQFQGHVLRAAGLGALIGVAGGIVTLAALAALLGRGEAALLPGLNLAPVHWALLSALFPAAALLAAATARATVLRALARLS